MPRRLIYKRLRMAHKDSDYTIGIAIMHCPHHTILVLKLALVVEIQALFCSAVGRHITRTLSSKFVAGTALMKAPQ